MLMDAYHDEQPGIRITYRTDEHLLNSRHMQAPTRVSTTTVHDLLFVDDCALNTVTLMFSAMLMDTYRDEQPGIRIAYRNDGHLLNSRRMQAPMRVSTTTVHDLLFVDDCALNTVT
ncbi:unnamed protein product [Schistocephalus solidus]|uniref:Uncharacterized protein n=1 Tax=Schistocephalus solidus TaxID=70667 RepID=A0A183T3R1_SCHSO|nr:unnamed protein product [Schistocephalus solidus]